MGAYIHKISIELIEIEHVTSSGRDLIRYAKFIPVVDRSKDKKKNAVTVLLWYPPEYFLKRKKINKNIKISNSGKKLTKIMVINKQKLNFISFFSKKYTDQSLLCSEIILLSIKNCVIVFDSSKNIIFTS